LRLPHGATARVRPYKSQNVFLKNYSKDSTEILRSLWSLRPVLSNVEGMT
jgi:hypothetical protein